MFIDVFDEFDAIIEDCVDYFQRVASGGEDVQDIHDYDHDAYVVVQ